MTSQNKFIHLSDFTGGLVTKMPPVDLELNQSPDLDNVVPLDHGFKKRFGDSEFNATAMNSAANVQGLAYYKEDGGNEFLVAIAGDKIFRSDDLDGTMDELSLAGGSAAPAAGQNNIWTPMILNNLLVWVGGPSTSPNPPKSWDGSTNTNDYQNLAGSPPSGHFGFVTRDRGFIGRTAADPSQIKWSVLSDIEDWTGTGSGSQVIYTSDGDHLVGGIPINNDLVLLFKQYSIHYLMTQSAPFPTKPFLQGMGCVGKHAMVNVKGLVFFISMDKRMRATDGYSIQSFPDNIDDIWDDIPDNRREYIQGTYIPGEELIVWNVTKGAAQTKNNYAIVWDLKHKSWWRYTTGYDVNVGVIAQGLTFYTGQYAGKIYKKMDSSTNNDASEGGVAIHGKYTTPQMSFGNMMTSKQVPIMTVAFKTQTDATISASYGYDYTLTRTETLSTSEPGSLWDGTDTWDESFVWGGQNNLNRTRFLRGRGNVFQMEFSNRTAGESMTVNSVDLSVIVSGALKELSAK